MKTILSNLESLSSLLDSLSTLAQIEEEEAEYLAHLISEIDSHCLRLLTQEKQSTQSHVAGNSREVGAEMEVGHGENLQFHSTEGKRIPPYEREDLLQRALQALACSHFDEAKCILKKAVATYPNDEEFYIQLALSEWELGEMEQAAHTYERAMGITCPDSFCTRDWLENPEHPFLRATEGRALALYQLERYSEAVRLFEMVYDFNPDRYSGCIYLAGEIYHILGKVDKALQYYALSPFEPCLLYNKGLAFFEQGNVSEAAETFIHAFSLNPHIAAKLIGRQTTFTSIVGGFLGTPEYANDFLSVCSRLWNKPKVKPFVENLFLHPLVQSHLAAFDENGNYHAEEEVIDSASMLHEKNAPMNKHVQRIVKRLLSSNHL